MKDLKELSDQQLREALKRREEELTNVSSGFFGREQRALYSRILNNFDAIKRELELRKIEEKERNDNLK